MDKKEYIYDKMDIEEGKIEIYYINKKKEKVSLNKCFFYIKITDDYKKNPYEVGLNFLSYYLNPHFTGFQIYAIIEKNFDLKILKNKNVFFKTEIDTYSIYKSEESGWHKYDRDCSEIYMALIPEKNKKEVFESLLKKNISDIENLKIKIGNNKNQIKKLKKMLKNIK